ncbi:IS607 family transposase, partial [Micromonospora sp. NPDC050200]
MKLSEWARQQGVSYQTAWRWVKDGKMPVPVRQAPSGTWIVTEPAGVEGRVVGYCRVSFADQGDDLGRQAMRVVEGANAQGLAVSEVVKE